MALVHAVDRLEGAVVEEPLSPVQGVVQCRAIFAVRDPREGCASATAARSGGKPMDGVSSRAARTWGGLRPSGTKSAYLDLAICLTVRRYFLGI